MWRTLVLPILLAIIAASCYSAWKWGIEDEDDVPENDPQVRERVERQRQAGVR
jgi:hypothetical protein